MPKCHSTDDSGLVASAFYFYSLHFFLLSLLQESSFDKSQKYEKKQRRNKRECDHVRTFLEDGTR